MCNQASLVDGSCKIQNSQCPFLYLCGKTNTWKVDKAMPENCKVKQTAEIPKGYVRVRFERKGYLYVDLGDQTVVVKNPWKEVPQYVRAYKTKDGNWRVRK